MTKKYPNITSINKLVNGDEGFSQYDNKIAIVCSKVMYLYPPPHPLPEDGEESVIPRSG